MLRLFLALSVVIHHIPKSPFHWLHASVAVMFFFMVSGFYMTLVINEKYIKSDTPWVKKFYLSRVFRIFPVYLAMQLFMIVWYIVTDTPSVFSSNMGHDFLGQLSLIAMNVFILGQDFHQLTAYSLASNDVNTYTAFINEHSTKSYFDNSVMLIGQAWTLSVEFLFYLIAPFILHSRRRVIALLIASLLVRLFFWDIRETFNPLAWGYFFLPSTLCFFLMGSLGYSLYQQIIKWPRAKAAAAPINALVAAGIVYIIAMDGYPLILRESGYDTVALWVFYCAFALCLPFVFLLWKDNALDRWLGDFSYPVYIVHGVIIGALLEKVGLPVGTYSTQAIIIGVSLLVAWLACVAIESPFNNWRQRRIIAPATPELSVRSKQPLIWASAATVMTCLYVFWLTAYTPLQAPPAQLVKVEQDHRYNIVRYNNKFYGIAFGTEITWGGRNYEDTPGLIIEKTQEAVSAAIYKRVSEAASQLKQ